MIVAIVNGKGGVGKSTLTAQLALRAAQECERVAIVDADPQGSLRLFYKLRQKEVGADELRNPELFEGDDEVLDAVDKLKIAGFDIIFIDTAPLSVRGIREALEACTFALIPLKPSHADLASTNDTITLANDADRPFGLVFNDVDQHQMTMAKNAQQYAVSALGAHVFDTMVGHRVAFVRAQNTGLSVRQIEGSKGKGSNEIEALWAEVKTAIKAGVAKSGKAQGGKAKGGKS
ncbi:MAG: ParA family protein [Pseudomonadota bacterium]